MVPRPGSSWIRRHVTSALFKTSRYASRAAGSRQQLDPAAREAYLEILKSADVSKINRGDTKSVRLVFEITPGFLEAARRAPPVMPDSAPSKPPLPGKAREIGRASCRERV